MVHRLSERRPHGGQDAHRTMGRNVGGPADIRHGHVRSGEPSVRGSDRFRGSRQRRGPVRLTVPGHGHRPRGRPRTRQPLSTTIPSDRDSDTVRGSGSVGDRDGHGFRTRPPDSVSATDQIAIQHPNSGGGGSVGARHGHGARRRHASPGETSSAIFRRIEHRLALRVGDLPGGQKAPESHQAARADPIASHPPSPAQGACDPHG
jgi:hypothetical protein